MQPRHVPGIKYPEPKMEPLAGFFDAEEPAIPLQTANFANLKKRSRKKRHKR